jgi:hypothetical protein
VTTSAPTISGYLRPLSPAGALPPHRHHHLSSHAPPRRPFHDRKGMYVAAGPLNCMHASVCWSPARTCPQSRLVKHQTELSHISARPPAHPAPLCPARAASSAAAAASRILTVLSSDPGPAVSRLVGGTQSHRSRPVWPITVPSHAHAAPAPIHTLGWTGPTTPRSPSPAASPLRPTGPGSMTAAAGRRPTRHSHAPSTHTAREHT